MSNIIEAPKFELIYTPTKYKKIHGFFDFEEIYQEAVFNAKDGAHFIEVGVMMGKSACYLAECIKQSGKKIRVDLIDKWDCEEDLNATPVFDYTVPYGEGQTAYPEGARMVGYPVVWKKCINTCMKNLERAGVLEYFNFIQYDSHLAHILYAENTIDFIFIDGDHSFKGCYEDLVNFYPKVKKGKIFAGHDYSKKGQPGVVMAVDSFRKSMRLDCYVNTTKVNVPFYFKKS